MKPKRCKDCAADDHIQIKAARPATHPGPRCATHWRAERKRRSAQKHDRMIARTYNINADQYQLLLDYQSAKLGNPPGTCAVCGIANGKTKRLAVDHDHQTGKVRGILCGFCNKDVIGRLTIEALQRAINYKLDPPGKILQIPPMAMPADAIRPDTPEPGD